MDDAFEDPEGLGASGNKIERIKQNLRIISPTSRKLGAKQRSFLKEKNNNGIQRENTFPNLRNKRTLSDNNTYNGRPSESSGSLNSSQELTRSLPLPDSAKLGKTNQHRHFLRRMSSKKSMTAPDLFNIQEFRSLHEENMLRKRFREILAFERVHTMPVVAEKELSNKTKFENFAHMTHDNDSYIYDIESDMGEEERESVMRARRKSIEDTGLWQLASSSAFKYKAMKNMNIEDLSMAMYTKRVAKERMRKKINDKLNEKLDLPDDPFKRVVILRNNVKHIERRFRSMATGVSSENSAAQSIHALQRNLNQDDDAKPKFLVPGEAMNFFRKYARIVLIILKWIELIMDSSEQNKLERELKSFVDIANEVQQEHVSKSMDEYGLSFDKNAFKARKEISLTQDHRKTLTTRWNFRTPEMVKQVMHGLQALRSLSEYPLGTQEKLCQVAWYQTLGPKKAIVRQGHNAESFYFILSGTAFVKKMITDPKTKETRLHTVARLTKGQSFGEIGLIFNTLRTATVESATPMELLVIGKDDFNRIFMNDNQDEEAEHVKFLRQVPVMQHWPIESLRDEPGTCILHYFKRGQLVSDNGKTSEWLYFIKSGSCEVLKKLKNCKARKCGQAERKPDPMSEIVLPVLVGRHECKVDSGYTRKRPKIYMNTDVFEEMTKYYESLKRQLFLRAHSEEGGDGMTQVHFPPLNVSSTQQNRKVSFAEDKITGIESDTIDQLYEVTQVPSHNDKQETEIIFEPVMRIPAVSCESRFHKPVASESKFNAEKFPWLKKFQAHFMLPTQAMLKSETPPDKPKDVTNDEDYTRKNSVFVKIELLQSKDVFGINTLTGWGSEEMDDMLKEAPATCLVSKGAEIVMLSKKVFLKYLTEGVRSHLREIIRPYPLERKMQENFQTTLDWQNYKTSILGDILGKHVSASPMDVH